MNRLSSFMNSVGGLGCNLVALLCVVLPVFLSGVGMGQTIYKIDNTIPAASDGVSSNGWIPIGTVNTKSDFSQVYAGVVIKAGSTYQMWYTGKANDNKWRICLATSPDAITWTKYNTALPSASDTISSNGTIAIGASSERGDCNNTMTPAVIKEGAIYKMWYAATDNSVNHSVYSPYAPYTRIYHATSTNGIDWIKYDNFIVPSSDGASGAGRVPTGILPRGDHLSASAPCVIREGAGFRMWYAGDRGGSLANGKTSTIFCATSPDGLTWTKVANTVPAKSDVAGDSGRIPLGNSLDSGDARYVSGARVIQQGMNYLMWYSGCSTAGNWRIYHATSPDGLTWAKKNNSIQSRSDDVSANSGISLGNLDRGDASHTLTPVVLEDGPVYRVWYTGVSTAGVYRAYAAAWTADVPNVHVAGISNVSDTAATLYGELTSTGTAETAVSCYWGSSDGGTNSVAWSSNNPIAASAVPGSVSLALSSLVSNSAYVFRFLATNLNGQCVSASAGSLITAPVEIQSPWRGGFVISRPASVTNFDLAVNYTISGTATNWLDYYPLTGQDWIRAGATSAVIYIRANLPNRLSGKTVTLTLAPGGYLMGSATTATTTFDPVTWYVATNGVNGRAGTNSVEPLRTVEHAADRAISGDTISIAGGTNYTSDMLNIEAGVTLRGAAANRAAIIQRSGAATSMPYFRVMRVNHANAIVDGLSIQGGLAQHDSDPLGGGIKLLNGLVTNCLIINNLAKPPANSPGGCGAYVGGGTLIDSTLSGNHNNGEGMWGGGLYLAGGIVRGCVIEKNYIDDDNVSYGGGAFVAGGVLSHCTIRSNYIARTVVGGKRAGGVYSTGGTIRNCLIYANRSTEWSGGGYVAGGAWENCVVIGNSSGTTNGGLYFAGGSATNIIVYNNFSPAFVNIGGTWATRVAFSCAPELTSGVGNISLAPLFVDNGSGSGTGTNSTYRPGDYHLQNGSPCIAAGAVQPWMTAEVELDGKPRLTIDHVDMGIYQRMLSGSCYAFR